MPVISVIIPTHNRSHFLARTLASLPQGPDGLLEVIVVDDGSTDDTGSIVRNSGRNVTFLRQEQAGPGAARNLGLEAASGRYAAFLDSDDVWLPWTLSIYRQVLRRYPAASFIAGAPFWFTDEAEIDTAAAGPAGKLDARCFPDYFASAAHPIWLGASCLLVRRDCRPRFEPSHMNAEDLDFALHFGTEPGFVWIRQPCTFGYRRHGPTAVGNFARTLKGINHLVEEERRGRYPGGNARRRERLALITRAVRPPVVEALKRGQWREAGELYRRTFSWHLSLRRWKFLLACPAWLLPLSVGKSACKTVLPTYG
ncbi:MAG: glycosyltransferase family 2 protein [Verrucomicrobia bacterium]|nr:glycosyltransferase family 2 protein [Verrucomicrobiota bacterium]